MAGRYGGSVLVAPDRGIRYPGNGFAPDLRDSLIRAALHDARALCKTVATELQATYRGDKRDIYVRMLGGYVADLGGRLEETGGRDLVARFGERCITLRFD